MTRHIFLTLVLLLLSLLAGPVAAQDSDRARQKKRIAEIEKEIAELKARLEILNADLYKLKEAIRPVFKEETMATADAKMLQGKWQAVRVTWDGDIVVEKSLAKIQLEISEHGYRESGGRVKVLGRGKTAYEAESPEKIGTWSIDPTTNPKTIGFWGQRTNLAQVFPIYGIYQLKGDTLSICWGNFMEPPSTFDDRNITIYKRITDEGKKPAK